MEKSDAITVSITTKTDINKVWEAWTNPLQIMKWNFASDDWHCPAATNDLKVGGKFCYTMAAKDKSFSFDFEGIYTEVVPQSLISYRLADDREVHINFSVEGDSVTIKETFDPENENTLELQRDGWQAILDNFKKVTDSL